jgi:hypothetical protein
MPFQESVPGVGTTAGPSWMVHDDDAVWMAWKGSGTDTSIWVASAPSLTPDASGVYTFTPQAKVLTLSTGSSPAITSLEGTLYLFYRAASDDDHIRWATCAGGTTWVDQGRLALGAGGATEPRTGAAPAVASANSCLYLFWKGSGDDTIWWAVTSDGTHPGVWSDQTKVTTTQGSPQSAYQPAVTLRDQTIHLVVKDSTAGSTAMSWTTYTTPVNPHGDNTRLDTGGTWTPLAQIGSGAAHAPALACDGNLGVWLAWTEGDGGVSFAHLANGAWWPVYNRFGIGSSDRPALISTGQGDAEIMMAWKGADDDGGIYYGTLIGPQVPPGPTAATKLGGSLNYLMADGCKPLKGVSVVIDVTEDIVSDIGIGFQLNAYSKAGAHSAWQQFLIFQNVVTATEVAIDGFIETWPQSTAGTGIETTTNPLIRWGLNLGPPLPSTKIPAKYQFTITLGTDGSNRVDHVQFRVVDQHGHVAYGKPPIKLTGLPLLDGTVPPKATDGDLAEIVAFQLNIVGPIGNQTAKLTSGAGVITYSLDGLMNASSSLPTPPGSDVTCADSQWHTKEEANTSYSTLPQGTGTDFIQTFATS